MTYTYKSGDAVWFKWLGEWWGAVILDVFADGRLMVGMLNGRHHLIGRWRQRRCLLPRND